MQFGFTKESVYGISNNSEDDKNCQVQCMIKIKSWNRKKVWVNTYEKHIQTVIYIIIQYSTKY